MQILRKHAAACIVARRKNVLVLVEVVAEELVVVVLVDEVIEVVTLLSDGRADVAGVVDMVVVVGKEAHGGQTPSYTRKPWWWMLKWN